MDFMEDEELPFVEDSSANDYAKNEEKDKKKIVRLLSIIDRQDEALEHYYGIIDDLEETIDLLFRDLLLADLEIVKWRQSLIKYLHPAFANLLDLDILNGLHSADEYRDNAGFTFYIKDYCRGKCPDSDSSYRRRLDRIKDGISSENDILTFSISRKGGLGMLDEALSRIYDCVGEMAEGKGSLLSLKAHLHELKDVVSAYDTENQVLLTIGEKLIKELDETDLAMRKMGEEISFLYHLLRDSNVDIPLEGHPVSIKPFVDWEDPDRCYFEGEYRLPHWFYFDEDVE